MVVPKINKILSEETCVVCRPPPKWSLPAVCDFWVDSGLPTARGDLNSAKLREQSKKCGEVSSIPEDGVGFFLPSLVYR